MLLCFGRVFDCLSVILVWISLTTSTSAASSELSPSPSSPPEQQQQQQDQQEQQDLPTLDDPNKLQSDRDSAAFYKFPNPYCKHVGQFLPHPTNKCVYLRCDYGSEHWIGKKAGSLPLFTIEQACPPGVAVNRTTFYYARYWLEEQQSKSQDEQEENQDFDPNDPYNFPISPCTIVDADCALVIPPSPEPEKPRRKPSRSQHRPRYGHPRRRHKPRQPIADENDFIRPEDLPDSPGNPYR